MKYLLTVIITLFVSLPAMSAPTGQQLRDRLLLEMLAYRSTTEFSLISLTQGSNKAVESLQQVIAEGDILAVSIRSEWPDIEKEWRLSREFLISNQQAAIRGEKAGLPTEVKLRQESLYQAFDNNRPQSSGFSGDDQTLVVLLDNLERIVAAYLSFNMSLFGVHTAPDTGIAVYASRFDETLERVKDPQFKQRIASKWQFVRDTLLAYNERSAVFIVDRTGRSIRDMLQQEVQPEHLAAE